MAILSQESPRQRDRVILFGGQGSSSLFSHAALAAAEDNCKRSLAASILASRCHAAFLEEYGSLHNQERHVLGIDIHNLHSLKDFLNPCQAYHRNGLIQFTTICMYQLIQYTADIDLSTPNDGHLAESILETTGFCSGLLPAAVVVSSQSSSDIIKFGTEALRVAFWIACRTILEGHKQVQGLNDHDAWSIVVKGFTRSQVQEQLDRFTQQVSSRVFQAFSTQD